MQPLAHLNTCDQPLRLVTAPYSPAKLNWRLRRWQDVDRKPDLGLDDTVFPHACFTGVRRQFSVLETKARTTSTFPEAAALAW
jgi:hypothetical protein